MIFGAFLALIALIVAIIAIAQLSVLRARIEILENKLGRRETPTEPEQRPSSVPPPLPSLVQQTPIPVLPRQSAPAPMSDGFPNVNWESFVGVRLFAWIGGLAFFLGVVFFVKYAFENNLVSPAARITLSGVT